METRGGPPRCYDSLENGNVHGPDFSPQEAELALKLAELGIPLSGRFSFKDLRPVFIRDLDRNVIELDAYAGDEPETRAENPEYDGYRAHQADLWSDADLPF